MPSDPTLYLYTSLTAGSSHIITATSRIETILKANKIPFKAVDCATDDKARMLWARRSKGRKIPGLVKFNDVIADLEQVEEWNEYGELEEQIEDQVDIFGDVPISATSAEAHAVAAARAQAAQANASSQARTASETRHISISDPKDKKESNPAATPEKKDTPLSMAMRQAGAEAAAKAGQKKTDAAEAFKSASVSRDPADKENPAPAAASPKLDVDAEEVTKIDTAAKTPEQLAAQGAKRVSVDKLSGASSEEPDETPTSTQEQIIDQRRKSSVPNQPSALAKSTSIDESHTVASEDGKAQPVSSDAASKELRGPSLDASDQKTVGRVEKDTTTTEDDDEDEEDEEDEKDDDSDDDEEEDEEKEPVKKAATVSASNKGEEKVLQGSKPQEQKAGDETKASASVGD